MQITFSPEQLAGECDASHRVGCSPYLRFPVRGGCDRNHFARLCRNFMLTNMTSKQQQRPVRTGKRGSTVSGAQQDSHPVVGLLSGLRELSRVRILQLTALIAALSGLTWIVFTRRYCVTDLDVFWHLAVGNWIVQHGSVPHTGILSGTAANLPWIAYSWGSEVLLSRAYAWLGLMGLGVFGSALTFMVALVLLWSLLRLAARFWIALVLWAATCFGSLFSLAPRPVFFSMAFYVVVLTLILEAERSGNTRRLWLLPPLFLLWANLHIQFIYGLFLIGLLLVPPVIHALANLHPAVKRWIENQTTPPRLRLPRVAAVLAACVAATCVGPYSYHLYNVVINYSRAKLTYSTIQELQPVSYTDAAQYVPLLITAAAFFALGKRTKISLYQALLLTTATLVSVRTMRDTWFICFTAAIIIAETLGAFPGQVAERTPARQIWLEATGAGAAWVLIILLVAQSTRFNSRDLNRTISANFPVDACNYLRQTLPPGPMYNSFNWGGFLTWYLPMYPVAVDGRNDLYSGRMGEILLRTESDANFYQQNPYLNESGFVLVNAKESLARQLSVDPGYRRTYSDGQAEIYVHNSQ